MQSDDYRTNRSGDEEDLQLPDDLIQGLKRFDTAVAVISPDADRRVAEAAAAHFGERPRRARGTGRRWAMAGSLAASFLVGVVFWRMQTPVEEARLAPVAPAGGVAVMAPVADDIDGSGGVDILDAFALARMARRAGTPPASDAPGDVRARVARTDHTPAVQARIDALAMRVVALNGAGEKL